MVKKSGVLAAQSGGKCISRASYGIAIVIFCAVVSNAALALDRSTALSVIQNSKYFPRYELLTSLPIGKPVNIKSLIDTASRMDQKLAQDINTGYECAKNLGFLSIRSERKQVFGTDMGTFYHVSVTSAGLKNGRIVKDSSTASNKGFEMPLCKKNAVRVTGIKMTNSSSAVAFAETGITQILPAGQCVYPSIESQQSEVTGKYRVSLSLYDDGWRVESAQVSGRNGNWIDEDPASHFNISPTHNSSGSRSKGNASSSDSLDRESVKQIQSLLSELGYDTGIADGIPGAKTRTAIKNFQRDKGLAETGESSASLLSILENGGVVEKPEDSAVSKGLEGLLNLFKRGRN